MSATPTTASASSVPFVTTLRTPPAAVTVGDPHATDTLHLRVEMQELWDAVRVNVSANEPVLAVKVHALQALAQGTRYHDDYVVKLRGCEIFDETQSVQQAGAIDGSIFILVPRRRRPVR